VSLSGRKTPGGTSRRTRRFISSPALRQTNASAPDAHQLRAIFDAPGPLTVGVEDELMLLDPESLDLVTRAPEVLAALGEDPRFKLELPASQLEIVLPPLDGADQAARALAEARALLARRAAPIARPAALALHPFAATEGPLNVGERYARIERQYGPVARRQLLCALQVHVAVRGADRALAVHNALREHLPALGALAAASPFHGGRDTGVASFRRQVADLLPRHGIPPALESWEVYAQELRALPEPGQWWWDVRPHPQHGTLEVRVPDAQASIADAEAIIAVVHALIAWLAARHDAGDLPRTAPTARLAAEREAAARDGLASPPGERVAALLDELAPVAAGIGGTPGLERARATLAAGGAPVWHRAVAAEGGISALTREIADRFTVAPAG
jgi:glutamate---cysteine ligase / carboxylate-amine ligase